MGLSPREVARLPNGGGVITTGPMENPTPYERKEWDTCSKEYLLQGQVARECQLCGCRLGRNTRSIEGRVQQDFIDVESVTAHTPTLVDS